MSLKILHTSDWHLGKKIYKTSRLAEQKLFLDWLIEQVIQEDIDALIVAGDIFDTPRPSDQALQVYFNFLQNLMGHTRAHLYLISGNHDSGRFLEAPKAILDSSRIHLSGLFDSQLPLESYQHRLTDGQQTQMLVTLMPYFRTFDLAQSPTTIDDQEKHILDSLSSFFEQAAKNAQAKDHHLLVAHHLFGSFQAAGSEQGLNLSGLETIPLSVLDKYFDYVALGHIHNPQWVKHSQPKTRYSGSPIPFRFSEMQSKSITYLCLNEDKMDALAIPIPCFRPLIQLKTDDENYLSHLQNILKELPSAPLPALIEVICEISSAQAGLADLMREICKDFPCELVSVQTHLAKSKEQAAASPALSSNTNTEKLFEMFYQQKFPDSKAPPEQMMNIFKELLEEIRTQEHRALDDTSEEGQLET